jgi:hypothetical protein
MDNKRKNDNDARKSGKVKVGSLKLNKETVKDLTDNEAKRVMGGAIHRDTRAACPSRICTLTPESCPNTNGFTIDCY